MKIRLKESFLDYMELSDDELKKKQRQLKSKVRSAEERLAIPHYAEKNPALAEKDKQTIANCESEIQDIQKELDIRERQSALNTPKKAANRGSSPIKRFVYTTPNLPREFGTVLEQNIDLLNGPKFTETIKYLAIEDIKACNGQDVPLTSAARKYKQIVANHSDEIDDARLFKYYQSNERPRYEQLIDTIFSSSLKDESNSIFACPDIEIEDTGESRNRWIARAI